MPESYSQVCTLQHCVSTFGGGRMSLLCLYRVSVLYMSVFLNAVYKGSMCVLCAHMYA